VSGRTPPPRQRRLVDIPRQPYPPADDFDVPVDSDPIPLTSEYVPTMRDLSEQIGAVSSHLTVVHKECALTRAELGQLRTYVMTDHAPRITEVERRAPVIPHGVKKGGAVVGIAAVYPLLEWLIPIIQKWIESR